MNGPSHYREAERLLADVSNVTAGDVQEAGLLAEAQVHAILALTAATVANTRRNGLFDVDAEPWAEVLG